MRFIIKVLQMRYHEIDGLHDESGNCGIEPVEKKSADFVQQQAGGKYTDGIDGSDKDEEDAVCINAHVYEPVKYFPCIALNAIKNDDVRGQMIDQAVGKMHFFEKEEKCNGRYYNKYGIIAAVHAEKGSFQDGHCKIQSRCKECYSPE